MPFQKKPPISDLAYQLSHHVNRYGTVNVSAVARHYGASRRTVYSWIADYERECNLKRDCQWSYSQNNTEFPGAHNGIVTAQPSSPTARSDT